MPGTTPTYVSSQSPTTTNAPSHDDVSERPSSSPSSILSLRPSSSPSLSSTVYPSSAPTPSDIGPPANASLWVQIGDIDRESAQDSFGLSIAVSEDAQTIAVGSPTDDNANGNKAGSVKIFRYASGEYRQLGDTIILTDGNSLDQLGQSVALSSNGNTCIVGAKLFDGRNGANSGVAKVFTLSSNEEWLQKGASIEGTAAKDNAGSSVAISDDGDIVAVGASLNDNANGNSAGHVRLFRYIRNDNSWVQLGRTLIGESVGDGFGSAVAMSGDGRTIGIGGPLNDKSRGEGQGYYYGHARVFRLSNNDEWIQLGDDIDGDDSLDLFGSQVSLSSDGNIIGIGKSDGTNNAVTVFQLEDNQWSMLGDPIDGWTVSLSNNGKTVAVGSYQNVGQIRILNYADEKWVQIGDTLLGEAVNSNFGRSVAISGDGQVVVGGSPGLGQSGSVRVFHNNIDGSSGWLKSGRPYFRPVPSSATLSKITWTMQALVFVSAVICVL